MPIDGFDMPNKFKMPKAYNMPNLSNFFQMPDLPNEFEMPIGFGMPDLPTPNQVHLANAGNDNGYFNSECNAMSIVRKILCLSLLT